MLEGERVEREVRVQKQWLSDRQATILLLLCITDDCMLHVV